MKITQSQWTPAGGWNGVPSDTSNLVIAFGATDILSSPERMSELTGRYPGASVIGCSTAGEICGTRVTDETLNVTAIRFERGVRVATVKVSLAEVAGCSHSVGLLIAKRLPKDGLTHVFVLSCGLNGSQLTRGLVESLPDGVGVTGGLSGDGARFARTLVLLDGEVSESAVIAVGFYGPLRVGCGSMGGWDPFGPDRLVTRSQGNVVFELDGQSALGLYKQYLGDHAKGLPSSGLLFPLSVRVPGGEWISDDRQGLSFADATSAVFAYDIPWDKIDVATFSWQKALGGEGGHGVLILGPRAVERLESFTPDRPLPKLFRLTSKGKLGEGVFKGETINTPSMLAVEDAIVALEWAKSVGGLQGMIARTEANAAALDRIVDGRDWLGHLARDPARRSTTSVCLTVAGADEARIKAIAKLLETEGVAFDIAGYRDAPPSFRIWCGATVDTADIEALGPWLDWAFEETNPA